MAYMASHLGHVVMPFPPNTVVCITCGHRMEPLPAGPLAAEDWHSMCLYLIAHTVHPEAAFAPPVASKKKRKQPVQARLT